MVSSRSLALYCKYVIGDKCKYLGIKLKKTKKNNNRKKIVMPPHLIKIQLLAQW